MLFNGRALIFTFSGTRVRIAEIERLQSLFKTSMGQLQFAVDLNTQQDSRTPPEEIVCLLMCPNVHSFLVTGPN